MSMLLSDLATDLKAILKDAADKFTAGADADFIRHLELAALDFGRKRRRTLAGTFTLVADEDRYTAPADLISIKAPVWGRTEQRRRKPWDKSHPGRLPSMSLIEEAGVREINLFPAPSAEQIACLGSDYRYFYYAGHTLSDTPDATTVLASDRDLLLLRATIVAMGELAFDGVTKPVRLGSSGVGSMPKNGTPAALAEQLFKQYEAAR